MNVNLAIVIVFEWNCMGETWLESHVFDKKNIDGHQLIDGHIIYRTLPSIPKKNKIKGKKYRHLNSNMSSIIYDIYVCVCVYVRCRWLDCIISMAYD